MPIDPSAQSTDAQAGVLGSCNSAGLPTRRPPTFAPRKARARRVSRDSYPGFALSYSLRIGVTAALPRTTSALTYGGGFSRVRERISLRISRGGPLVDVRPAIGMARSRNMFGDLVQRARCAAFVRSGQKDDRTVKVEVIRASWTPAHVRLPG
jgi:hypothetical protein